MKVLVLKSAKADLSWMVVEGTTRSDAGIVVYEKEKMPSGERDEQLDWVAKEVVEIITKHQPDVAAIRMSEGTTSFTERCQMDGVLLATLHRKKTPVQRLFTASIKSKFGVKKIEQVAPIVETLPACTPKTTGPQKELLPAALAVFPS